MVTHAHFREVAPTAGADGWYCRTYAPDGVVAHAGVSCVDCRDGLVGPTWEEVHGVFVQPHCAFVQSLVAGG